jgi:hypothetical protein
MFTFCLRFSGITIRFLLPTVITLPDNFAPFRCPDTSEADEEYRVELLRAPLHPQEPMLHQEGEAQIYHTGKGWLHIYPSLGDEAGCQVACLFCPDGHHTIYYPASRWAYYSRIWRCGHLICGERVLLRHDAFFAAQFSGTHPRQGCSFFRPFQRRKVYTCAASHLSNSVWKE